jgi:hypothetical protein
MRVPASMLYRFDIYFKLATVNTKQSLGLQTHNGAKKVQQLYGMIY